MLQKLFDTKNIMMRMADNIGEQLSFAFSKCFFVKYGAPEQHEMTGELELKEAGSKAKLWKNSLFPLGSGQKKSGWKAVNLGSCAESWLPVISMLSFLQMAPSKERNRTSLWTELNKAFSSPHTIMIYEIISGVMVQLTREWILDQSEKNPLPSGGS